MIRKPIELMTKTELLQHLEEEVPMGYWPPRPTRQDKNTLRDICIKARTDRLYAANVVRVIRKEGADGTTTED